MSAKKYTFFCLVFLLTSSGFSQVDLPFTQQFSEALEKGTRSTKGKPGKMYWQNYASYNIAAEILPEEKKLYGNERIRYENNSPDTLNNLVFHLYQNLYKKGNSRDFSVHPDDVHAGVKIKMIKIRNSQYSDYTVSGTQLIVDLEEPLYPSELININISWDFSIPSKSDVRMGAKNDSAFFLGQWYPKIAVYDDLGGWDRNMHTGNSEFYSEIGDYNYAVKVPEGYLVWGTGMLKNPKGVLSERIYERFLTAQTSDNVVSIVGMNDYDSTNSVTTDSTWKFRAKQVPDVAFAISNHHLWDGASLKKDSDKRYFIESAYPPDAEDFKETVSLAKKTLRYLSNELPGYPYPFPAVTVFNGTNGTSGMEYPMIANNPSADNRGRTVDVTAHEIAHNYFPFFVLTNETEHAWMDEAFASMIPYKFQRQTEPSLSRIERYAKRISKFSNTKKNIPTITNSTMLKDRSYYFNFYTKPAMALYFLEDMLGDNLFKECLIQFIEDWKGKHPTPYDFFNTFNERTKTKLNWYWNSWFLEANYPDLAIEKAEEKKNLYKIYIRRTGKLPVPVELTLQFSDNSDFSYHQTASIWKGKNMLVIPIKTNKKLKKINLGNEYIPDVNLKNNIYHYKQNSK